MATLEKKKELHSYKRLQKKLLDQATNYRLIIWHQILMKKPRREGDIIDARQRFYLDLI